jgi:hypothetical protein
MKRKIPLSNVEHPLRQKAIEIMEFIADYLGKPKIFDCKRNDISDTRWYDIEDKITEILNRRIR